MSVTCDVSKWETSSVCSDEHALNRFAMFVTRDVSTSERPSVLCSSRQPANQPRMLTGAMGAVTKARDAAPRLSPAHGVGLGHLGIVCGLDDGRIPRFRNLERTGEKLEPIQHVSLCIAGTRAVPRRGAEHDQRGAILGKRLAGGRLRLVDRRVYQRGLRHRIPFLEKQARRERRLNECPAQAARRALCRIKADRAAFGG